MPRPSIDLEPFRIEIEQQLNGGSTQEQVRTWLASQGVTISKNIISARVNAWGVSRHSEIEDSNPQLLAAIEFEFHSTHHDDQEIALAIISQGLHTTQNQVKKLRLAHNWRRRNDGEEMMKAREETFARVRAALNEGTCRSYGRGLLKTYLRLNGYVAREDDIRDALAHMDPQGTEARKRGPDRKNQGGEYIVPGRDFLWAIDGHDKFRNYGIEIYAGVDAYSRRILWIYVGNSNRRQVSILKQMVSVLENQNHCPKFWRSDRGKEVLLLADAHYSFYQKHRETEGNTPEQVDSLRFRDCYMFGTSTANIRIESAWMRLI